MIVGQDQELTLEGSALEVLQTGMIQPYMQTLTRIKRLGGDKHSSLLQISINFGLKFFITLGLDGGTFSGKRLACSLLVRFKYKNALQIRMCKLALSDYIIFIMYIYI
jgi:hypothetical protein